MALTENELAVMRSLKRCCNCVHSWKPWDTGIKKWWCQRRQIEVDPFEWCSQFESIWKGGE